MERHVYPRTVVSVILHYKNPTKRDHLAQSRPFHHFIENYLFSAWYCWKIAELLLINKHSLIHSFNLVDTSAGGLLVHDNIICSEVSVSTLVRYIIYFWNLQFINNVIIIKTNVLISQAWVTLTESCSLRHLKYLAYNLLPDKGYFRNALCLLNFISTFLLLLFFSIVIFDEYEISNSIILKIQCTNKAVETYSVFGN